MSPQSAAFAPIVGIRPTPESIDGLVAAMMKRGASYSHISNTATALERYSEFLGTPIKLGRPKKPYNLVRGTLSEGEVARLLAAAPSLREKAMLALLAYAGLRNRELCGLRIGDLDTGEQMIRIHAGKTQKDRAVPLVSPCMAVLVDYLHERRGLGTELMFLTLREGIQYQPQDLRKMIRKVATLARITKRVHPHLLRHSLATNLLERGSGVMAIKQHLGHVYLSTTLRYLHSNPARMQEEFRMHAPSYL